MSKKRTGKPGNPKGQHAKLPERRREALKLRKTGLSYREMAPLLGVSHVQAYKDVMKAIELLNEDCKEEAKEVKQLELGRLDTALKAIWPGVQKGDLKAISMLLRIQERRARYEGLDVAQKQEIDIATPEPIRFVPFDSVIDDKGFSEIESKLENE